MDSSVSDAAAVAAIPKGLIPYFSARWLCMQCGKYLAGYRNPPPQVVKCHHCGQPAMLDAMCLGYTGRKLPFFDKPPHGNFFGKIDQPYWQQQPVRRIHRKGYKRKAGEKDKLNGYHREKQDDD
jgi:hypothetical protein